MSDYPYLLTSVNGPQVVMDIGCPE